eukprot:CAMPEP_0174697412 /NCGR_PEP_ID=MMETSP1094-20130205/3290_1 /TAXON_ID=156173 /ORGANISM="Chrysochromulina brevifilum, Strain UTEX LB 985" /LENGTH=98 /DNA_ID=CAMNT_0015894385 /DNA_START=701 /DNA_END=997 /DNA_ORIENTATION=-
MGCRVSSGATLPDLMKTSRMRCSFEGVGSNAWTLNPVAVAKATESLPSKAPTSSRRACCNSVERAAFLSAPKKRTFFVPPHHGLNDDGAERITVRESD